MHKAIETERKVRRGEGRFFFREFRNKVHYTRCSFCYVCGLYNKTKTWDLNRILEVKEEERDVDCL